MVTRSESDLARRLLEAWVEANLVFAKGALRTPILRIETLGNGHLGHWRRDRRELAIDRGHVTGDPWADVMDTLRHEMAHQYADEVLEAVDESAHGPAFVRACERLRADPSATRRATGVENEEAQNELQRRSVRLSKLLALADGTANPNEAAAALEKARELLARDGVDPTDPRSAFATRQVGRIRKRHESWEYVLANVLGEGFGVDVVWVPAFDAREGREGTAMLLHGRPHQLQVAEHAHDYLVGLLEPSFATYLEARGLRGRRDRARYAHGFLVGVRDQIRRGQDLDRSGGNGTRTRSLIALGQDGALQDFVRWRHPSLRTSSVGSVRRDRTFDDARRDGREVRVRRPIGSGPGDQARRLLGPAGTQDPAG